MKTNTQRLSALLSAIVLSVVGISPSTAQSVPPLINYQGKLVNSNGVPLATDDYPLHFSLWDASAGGSLIWGPQHFDNAPGPGHGGKVPVMQGWFNVILGPMDITGALLTDAFNATNRFLEIRVGTNPPVLPRQQILSAPYSIVAAGVPNGAITPAMLSPEIGAKLNPGPRVTGTNVPVGGVALSLHSGYFETSAVSFIDVTNLQVTIETTGRPVWVALIGAENPPPAIVNGSHLLAYNTNADGAVNGVFMLDRDGEQITRYELALYAANALRKWVDSAPGSVGYLDQPGAGSHTYKVKVRNYEQGSVVGVVYCRLVVYEL